MAIAACGGDDVTTFTGPEEEASPLEPEASSSRTFEVLSEPSSLDAVCRFLGVSSVAGTEAAGDAEACSAVVEDCRDNTQAALGADDGAAGVGVPATDLEGVLGCPLTLPQLDACIAGALERAVAEYGSAIGCDMPALPMVDPVRLFATPACLIVALECPELIAGLAGDGG